MFRNLLKILPNIHKCLSQRKLQEQNTNKFLFSNIHKYAYSTNKFAIPPIQSNEPLPIDPDAERKLKILKLEVSVLRQEGRKVPSPEFLDDQQWDHLLGLKSKSARSKYYLYLWQLEMKKQNLKMKKEERRKEGIILKEQELEKRKENDHIIYSLSHTSMMLRIYDTTITNWHNHKLIQAMQFGQKLVLDCSYDKFMTKREAVNAAKQLMLCFAENRVHKDPFDLYFCNANFNAPTMQYLHKHIPTMMESHFPLNVHECSYLDLFPREQLVYLTPHCNNDLLEFNHDHIYIIGCMVDKINNEPLSLAKAKKLGLKMAKLPLDRYLQWGAGSGKSLTLNQMTSIMLDIKTTGNWPLALSHVPRRKVFRETEQEADQKRAWDKHVNRFQRHSHENNSNTDFENVKNYNNIEPTNVKNPFAKEKGVHSFTVKKQPTFGRKLQIKIPDFD